MSQNAYEIRHDLLNEARGMLFEIWNRKCDTVIYNADQKAPSRFETDRNEVSLSEVTLPPAPTLDEIIEVASKMNDFVKSKNPSEVTPEFLGQNLKRKQDILDEMTEIIAKISI